MYNIGSLYHNGRGVPQDYAKAHEWYEKAATKDNAAAMTNIGVLYADGHGVPQDYAKAHEWYEKAAAKDNAVAMSNIGSLYVNGRGVPQDYVKAHEWYQRAAAKGNADAMANIGGLYAAGHGVPQDYTQAIEWYEKAAATREASEIEAAGKPGPETASALGNVAWHALLAHQPARSLAAAERALSLTPGLLWIEINHAHALMFLDRADEARALYLAGMDKLVPNLGNKPWQQVIVEDFAELREAGLDHPMTAEVEAAFKNAR
jgi:uncharacterized protein YdaT